MAKAINLLKFPNLAPAAAVEPAQPSANPAAVALGRLGGIARAAALTERQRSDQARNAARQRWECRRLERKSSHDCSG